MGNCLNVKAGGISLYSQQRMFMCDDSSGGREKYGGRGERDCKEEIRLSCWFKLQKARKLEAMADDLTEVPHDQK